MSTLTPSKKPFREAQQTSPRNVMGLVLEEPKDNLKEFGQESQESLVDPQSRNRMKDLQEKRLALRRQCAHLQQRLHEFSAKSCEDDQKPKSQTATTEPSFTVENVFWQDERGNEATYSGPLNVHKIPHGSGGRMVYEDGSTVEGDFQNGKPHGEASYKGSDGCTYKGKLLLIW